MQKSTEQNVSKKARSPKSKDKPAATTKPKTKVVKKTTPKATPLKPETKNVLPKKKSTQLLAATTLVLVGVLLFLALISFTASDLEPEAAKTLNIFGTVGAHLANILLKLFGLSAFFFSAISILLGLFAFAGRNLEARPPELLGQSLLVFATAPLFQMLITQPVLDHSAGGVLGLFLSSLLLSKLDFIWAAVLCATLSLAGLLLVTNTKLSSVLRFCARIIKIISISLAKIIAAPFTYLAQNLRSNRMQLAPSLAGLPAQSPIPRTQPKIDRERSTRSILEKAAPQLQEIPSHWTEDPDTSELLGADTKAQNQVPQINEATKSPDPQNTSSDKDKLASILQKISHQPKARNTHKSRSIPVLEPSFEFDSIVSPEQLATNQVLANWKPRTLLRKNTTKFNVPPALKNKTLPPTIALPPSTEQSSFVNAFEPTIKGPKIDVHLDMMSHQSGADALTKPGPEAAEIARRMVAPKLNLTPAENITPSPLNDLKSTPAAKQALSQENTRMESIQNIAAEAVLEQKYQPRAFTRNKTHHTPEKPEDKITPIPVSRLNSVPSIASVTRAASVIRLQSQSQLSATLSNNAPAAGFVVAQAKQNASEEELRAAEHERQKRQNSVAFQKPPLSLLKYNPNAEQGFDQAGMQTVAEKIEEKLAEFKVKGKVTEICPGPVVTRFEFLPDPGTRVNSISNLSDDLKMALEVTSIRILAPIPGKNVVGIEIPNEKRNIIYIKEILASKLFSDAKSVLTLALGKDIEGNTVVSDLAKMPHLLVAGSTGSGKSVGINTMLCSLLYNATPDEVKLILVDPKCLELSIYNGIPHLLLPPITESEKAVRALEWACDEMDARYQKLADLGVRNIIGYNEKIKSNDPRLQAKFELKDENDEPLHQFMPYIVIVVDEFADLMMTAGKDIERAIARLAQKARAAGIHLILATQRPSTDVITGVIKANFPTRLAFRVFSYVDSRTILNTKGAEDLLGYGDSLFTVPNSGLLQRVHGAFISDEEVQNIADYLCEQGAPQYNEAILLDKETACSEDSTGDAIDDRLDSLYDDAVAIVANAGQASASLLQRRMGIGYNRAARLIEQLERQGVVGPANGQKAREVFVNSFED